MDTGLSVIDNGGLGLSTFAGQPVTANAILLKYTYYGDVDLNGQVHADDLTVFANNFGRATGAFQTNGDIDFEGDVDPDDLTVFANNFGKGVGSALSDNAPVTIAEPTSAVLAAIAATGILAAIGISDRRKSIGKLQASGN
jgi:hypothetical protein